MSRYTIVQCAVRALGWPLVSCGSGCGRQGSNDTARMLVDTAVRGLVTAPAVAIPQMLHLCVYFAMRERGAAAPLRPTSSSRSLPTDTKRRRTAVKQPWTRSEEVRLRDLVGQLGLGRWTVVASSMPERTAKQCRERWINHLDPAVNRSEWSLEEDLELIRLHSQFGNAWVRIAELLPGRTDNSVKNRWHSSTIRNCVQRERASVLGRSHSDSAVQSDGARHGWTFDDMDGIEMSSPCESGSSSGSGWSDNLVEDEFTLKEDEMKDFLDGIDPVVFQSGHGDAKSP